MEDEEMSYFLCGETGIINRGCECCYPICRIRVFLCYERDCVSVARIATLFGSYCLFGKNQFEGKKE